MRHGDPTTIAEGWVAMLADAPPGITPRERDFARLGFYSGARHMLAVMRGMATTPEVGQSEFNALIDELRTAFS